LPRKITGRTRKILGLPTISKSWLLFKGKPPARIDMFTYRDSGGFYLDKGTAHDVGGEYLLFLEPVSHEESVPAAARNAMEVNYSCGQSKTWAAATRTEEQQLLDLAGKK